MSKSMLNTFHKRVQYVVNSFVISMSVSYVDILLSGDKKCFFWDKFKVLRKYCAYKKKGKYALALMLMLSFHYCEVCGHIQGFVESSKRFLLNFFWYKPHIVNTQLGYHYQDVDTKMRACLYELYVEFVEKDLGPYHECIDGSFSSTMELADHPFSCYGEYALHEQVVASPSAENTKLSEDMLATYQFIKYKRPKMEELGYSDYARFPIENHRGDKFDHFYALDDYYMTLIVGFRAYLWT